MTMMAVLPLTVLAALLVASQAFQHHAFSVARKGMGVVRMAGEEAWFPSAMTTNVVDLNQLKYCL